MKYLKVNKIVTMKSIFKNRIAIVAVLAIFTSSSYAQISKAEIQATGLTCSMCSNAINKQLKSMPDVDNVDIDLNTNTFTVTLKDGNSLKPSVFKENVEKAGFFVGSLILTVKPETIKNNAYIVINDKESKGLVIQIQVLDKGYVTDKEFKKLSKSFKNITSYNTNNEGNFHIKILK